MFLAWKNQHCENDYTTQSNLQIQCNPYQITNGIFHRTRTKNFTICMETQKTPNSQNHLEKEKWSWMNETPRLQTIVQNYSNQESMVLAQKQKYRSMEQDRKPRDKPTHIWSPYYYFLRLLFYLFIYLFMAVLGLRFCVRAFSSVASGGHSSLRCVGLSLLWPLLLRSTGSRRAGSVIVAHGPSCSAARGIFPGQGSNLCPLHWEADSQPLRHQGSPGLLIFDKGGKTIQWIKDSLFNK